MPIINGDNNDNVLNDTPGDDVLNGMGGHDVLNITLGEDEANGGNGGDTLVIDWRTAINAVLTLSGPTVGLDGLEGAYSDNSGTRRVDYTGIERFEIFSGSGDDDIVTGGGHDVIYTGAGDDSITAGAGNDTLVGGTGADAMDGGTGNDTYYVDDSGDSIIEDAGEGLDVAYATASYVLAAGVHVELLSAAAIGSLNFLDLTGNELDNQLVGNFGDNFLDGGGGADLLLGMGGGDVLAGGDGNDTLDGGLDADQMAGGEGDDVYHVDNGADTVAELADEGRDIVYATVGFALAAGQSVEVLSTASIMGTAAIDLYGNDLANELYGNEGANRLEGGDGADVLFGFGGNDILVGGGGVDMLIGGLGDDSYYVDNAADVVREDVSINADGRDAVYASVSYVLAAGLSIEILSTSFLAGTAAIDLTGNQRANWIYGNEGANILRGGSANDTLLGLGGDDSLFGDSDNDWLDGGTGADTMSGGDGEDTYILDDAGDVVIETNTAPFGRDIVYTSVDFALADSVRVEILSAASIAGTAALRLTGNNLSNQILGNSGDNFIDGGAGIDQLTGYGGADTFAFTFLNIGNTDRIMDFVSGTDEIAVDNAVFAGLPDGPLSPDAFRAGTAAEDADDRIIYDAATGRLFFDSDGMGGMAQLQFAVVAPGTTIVAGDFTVI